METTTALDISRLVSDLENLAAASNSNNSQHHHQESSLPSLQQLYRLGLVLFQILQHNKQNRKSIDSDSVVTAYRDLIESIPDESLQPIFVDLRKASQRLLANSSSNNTSAVARDLALAVHSMEGLVGAFSDADSQTCNPNTESNSRLCRVIYDSAWISTLSAFYDRFIVLEKQQQQQQRKGNPDRMTKTEMESTQRAILSCLSRLVLDGLILGGDATVEECLLEAIRSMEEESTDCLRDLQEWQTVEEPFRRNLKDSLEAIEVSSNSIADEDEILERAQQREYIVSMLESAKRDLSSMAISAFQESESKQSRATAKKPMPVAMSSAADTELDRRIQQVLQILPHFGQGFVEVALGLHQGNVEATLSTLLHHPSDGSPPSSDYPTALRVLDPKLPRRKREFQAYQTAQEEAHSAEEARKDVKERMALEEKQRQDEYEALMVVSASQQQQQQQQQQEVTTESAEKSFAPPLPTKKLTRKELRQQKLRQLRKRDEYDDDYDDQYDEIEIKLGAADDGFTSDNMTFEQVKLYNQVVQEDESDSAFWESNRNTNQKGRNSDSSEKKWGPDKIKGGRVIGADGKVVRKPGGVKKKKTNNNNNNRNNNNANNTSKSNNNNNNKNNGLGGKPKANNNSINNTGNNAANNSNKKKPKTKPRSDNRVNRLRDRKLKKQGAFGVQD